MKYQGNLHKVGHIDISELQECVARQTESNWQANEFRQKAYAVHSATQTIYLVFDEDFRHFEATKLPKYNEFGPALKPLIQYISSYFDFQGWMVRCLLARLVSGGRIPQHSDMGFSLTHAHRLHIPIVTNPDVQFSVGDETVHMQAGEIWEINNMRKHSVVNNGAEHRIHMILDWAEPVTHADLRAYGMDRQRHLLERRAGKVPKYD